MEFIKRQWEEIRPNFKYDIIKWAVLSACAGVATVIAFGVRWIQQMRHAPQQDLLGYCILAMLVFCALLLIAIFVFRKPQIKPEPASPPLIAPDNAIAVLTKPPEIQEPPKPVDLQGKILELYIGTFDDMLHISKTYVVMKVRIKNHGPDDTTIVGCGLRVSLGTWRLNGTIMNTTPDNWRIRKIRDNSFLVAAYDEIPLEPHLRASEVYKKGYPLTGWLAFELYVSGSIEFPNAQFDLHVNDSFDGLHTITREPGVYPKTGELIRLDPPIPIPLGKV